MYEWSKAFEKKQEHVKRITFPTKNTDNAVENADRLDAIYLLTRYIVMIDALLYEISFQFWISVLVNIAFSKINYNIKKYVCILDSTDVESSNINR